MAAPVKCLAQNNKSLERAPRLTSGTSYGPYQTVAGLIMNEPIDLLRSHFGLTPAEARLALHLVAGETLRSAAAQFNVSYQTARKQRRAEAESARGDQHGSARQMFGAK